MERISALNKQLTAKSTVDVNDTLSVKDNRTGITYELPITNNYIRNKDMMKIKDLYDKPLRQYDPGYINTINATSKICFIDGDKGILRYRGYPIEQLAKESDFLEVAYLLIFGELPTKDQYEHFVNRVMNHTIVHKDVSEMMKSFRYDAHPMGMMVSTISALSTFHPEANPALQGGHGVYDNEKLVNKQIYRILGNLPTLAANAYRHRIGRKFNEPNSKYGYIQNFLYMLDKLGPNKYKPHPGLVKALNVLFILHAEHELNCSTAAMRHLSSSGVDIYTCLAGATSALYGPSHGGANAAVLKMLEEIGSVENVPKFIEEVKSKKRRLMGFGHRVYKNYDPRARLVQSVAKEVFAIVGKEPLIDLAKALETVALTDPYFIKKKLYPNVDFYSGVIYKALGFPTDMFPILFAIPRTAGWLAHWKEFLSDKDRRIVRPRQNYTGVGHREYVNIHERTEKTQNLDSYISAVSRRRTVSNEAKAKAKNQ